MQRLSQLANFIVLLPLLLSAGARLLNAADFSVGLVNSQTPGFSLQRQGGDGVPTWHVSTYLQPGAFVQVQSEIQQFFAAGLFPSQQVATAFYAGLGLKVVNEAAAREEETYWLRSPWGLQAELRSTGLQAFAELGLEVGPLPAAMLNANPCLGVRFRL